jgi:hypothetical protein
MARICLLHGHEVRHGRRRADIGVAIRRHVRGGRGNGAVLVGSGNVVGGGSIGIGHVVGGVHGLGGDVLVMMAMMVAVGGRIVLGTAAATGRRARGGRAHVGHTLHLLPSRQMPAVVHHAGVG